MIFLALLLAAIDPATPVIIGALMTGFVAIHSTSAGREKDLRAEVAALNLRLLELGAQVSQERSGRLVAEAQRDEAMRERDEWRRQCQG